MQRVLQLAATSPTCRQLLQPLQCDSDAVLACGGPAALLALAGIGEGAIKSA